MADPLAQYKAKRNFAVTSEPAEGGNTATGERAFVVQKHWASRLHYDLRLELAGSMKSWAVPKGPSLDPKDKRMAVQVEDHPIAYNQFEGEIPAGQYGAGKVIIWDEGTWEPEGDAAQGYRGGNLKFSLHGRKLHGRWALIRMKDQGAKQPAWLLIKEKDRFARAASEFSVVDELPDSVVPLRTQTKRQGTRAVATKKAAKTAKAAKAADDAHDATDTNDAAQPARPVPPGLPGTGAELPAELRPQLATLVDGVPHDPDDWLFEIKFDGYRVLARVEGRQVRLLTRNGKDWTHKLPHLARAIGDLQLTSGWLDGEIVILNDQGVPDFQRLQNAFDASRTSAMVYYLFDAPYLNGRDLREEPLQTRRALVRQLLVGADQKSLRFSEAFDARPATLLASACRMGLEGVIGKRKTSSYVSRRATTWIKIKCHQRQEFVVAGYTDPQGSRLGLGALLLAVYDGQGRLQYAGKVGTGFDETTLRSLHQTLRGLAVHTSPLASPTDSDARAHWVKPVLVAEIAFAEWTSGARVRQAVFHGLRTDKKPETIVREKPLQSAALDSEAGAETPPAAQALPPGLRVTHPERVLDPSTGLTKLDLVRFYALVAPLLLPHLKQRPVALLRAPAGITGELFFQKHLEGKMPGVKSLDPALDPEHAPLMEIANTQALLSAAQMNVIELHTWNGVKTAINKPDRMTFDLDPGHGVEWKAMQQAAELVRVFLAQLGLASFVKTSGGKGLHVVVALKKQHGWDTVKAFSHAIVQHLARTLPQLFVAKSGPKNRVGKIFVDYLRNGFGATTVCAWSARARPGLGVSVPISWDEVATIARSDQWNIANIHTRLDQGNTPWDGYAPQSLTQAMKRLEFPASAP